MWSDWTKFKRRGLHAWILYVLEISPKNGAEIMDAMENMSQGLWRPSPGSVYPLLDTMTKEGSIKKREDSKYELTEQGKEELDWPPGMRSNRPHTIEEILNEMNSFVSYFEDLAKSDPSKLTPHIEKIKEIQSRLSKITKT